MAESLKNGRHSNNKVTRVHREFSREEWLSIHNRSAGDYQRGEWVRESLLGVGKYRERMFTNAGGKVLDVACGYGLNFGYLPHDIQLTAIEFSPVMLAMAKRHAHQLGLSVDIREGDAEDLGFTDNNFDTVISALSTCSFTDPVAALREMRRVCKPDGKILLVEHGRSQNELLGWYQDRNAAQMVEQGGCRWNQQPHELVKEAGLEILSNKRSLLGIFHSIQAIPGKTY
jgi:ubiquinone/menaquinone biosynthesis C-methylase UbiE